jgi:hypothetical protein
MWWDILKNAKISGKTTSKVGGSLKDGDVKVSFDKKTCRDKLKQFSMNASRINNKHSISPTANDHENNVMHINRIPEEVACQAVKQIEAFDLNNLDQSFGRFIDSEEQKHKDSVEPISDGWQLGFFVVRDRIKEHTGLKFISFHCEIFKQSRYSGVQIITKYGLEKENAKILEHKDIDWRK